MASLVHGYYVVNLLHVGCPNGSVVELFLQRKTRTGQIWFLASFVLSNEESLDAVVRELFERFTYP
jgi:hypothetical protein